MISSIDQLDLNKRYSYSDYLSWKFDEMVELIRGKIFRMSPAPSRMHQLVGMRLEHRIFSFLEGRQCQVYHAPFDVRLPLNQKADESLDTVVQPDICVIYDLTKLTDAGCNGAPDWIIEILSPGTSHKDLNEKFDLYQESGVKEYWIVHPHEGTVAIYFLNEEDKYQSLRPQAFTRGNTVEPVTLPGLKIDLSWVFEEQD
jgi:Uma2 family endonuclease